MAQAAEQPIYTLNWVIGADGKGSTVLTNSSLPVVRDSSSEVPCHNSHKPVKCSAQMIGTQISGTEQFSLRLTSPIFDRRIGFVNIDILVQVKFDPSFLDQFIGGGAEVFFPLPIEKPIAEYRMHCVIMMGKLAVVLTNSSLPVVRDSSSEVPCHNSHKPVKCSAQMIGTQISGTEQFSLRLTSPMLHSEILIQVDFDPSFLDLFIGGETNVFFPLPNEKPIDYGMITPTDENRYVVLTNPNLPIVGITVIVGNIPFESIKYTAPPNRASDKKNRQHKVNLSSLPEKSKTPVFSIENDETVRRCTLPDQCLITIPCHDGHVPVSAKVAWSQMSESDSECRTSVLLLSSRLLETPIYVQIDHSHSFLEKIILGEIKVCFPLPIHKKMYSVEIKDIDNFKFKCLKGEPGWQKASIRQKKEERMTSGEIGHDCDPPLPNNHKVQRPNQVWSIFSNNWELIRKPKPRNVAWEWDDLAKSWVCKLDATNRRDGLKLLDRSQFDNCR